MILSQLGRQAKWVLPFGLLLGFALPQTSIALSLWIPHFIALLLLIACLQIKHAVSIRAIFSSLTFRWIVAAQLCLPVLVWALLSALGLSNQWIIPAVLVASAAPLTGGPSLVIILKGDAQQALSFLLAGTLVLPLTCIPGLYLIDSSGSLQSVAMTSFKLLLLISFIVAMAWLVRKYWLGLSRYRDRRALDGLSALCLAVVVIGLMAGFHEPQIDKTDVIQTFFWAIFINCSYQLLGYVFSHKAQLNSIAAGVSTGNRNIALFLTALPLENNAALLLFIACYQIPMYLTPLVGGFLYPASQKR